MIKKSRKSFSLLEVVLACTVLIMFLLAGVILFGAGLRNIVVSKHRLQAIYLANQKIEEKRIIRDTSYFQPPAVLPGLDSGSDQSCPIDLMINDCTYDVVVENGPTGGNSRKITVTVNWQDYSRDQSVAMYSYLTLWQNP